MIKFNIIVYVYVYFYKCVYEVQYLNVLFCLAERKQSLGYDWHPECLRCQECGKRLNPGLHAEVFTWFFFTLVK